jgi:hypothetical protein
MAAVGGTSGNPWPGAGSVTLASMTSICGDVIGPEQRRFDHG